MRPTPLLTAGAVVALVGLVLLVVEVARVLGGSVLGSAGATFLWIGVGLVAAGGVALVLATAAAARGAGNGAGPRLYGGEPADG